VHNIGRVKLKTATTCLIDRRRYHFCREISAAYVGYFTQSVEPRLIAYVAVAAQRTNYYGIVTIFMSVHERLFMVFAENDGLVL